MESNYESQSLAGNVAMEKVRKLLKHFRSAMMITKVDGQLHSRPMGIQHEHDEFNGTLWFFADRDSRKAEELHQDPEMSLIFQNDDDSAYLHLFGTAHVVDDRAKMKELFNPLIKTWFPKGLEDPRITLIRFDADRGDFWESPGGMLQVLAAFTKAIVTGERGQGGEMGEVRL
jgi:general stress protein 26